SGPGGGVRVLSDLAVVGGDGGGVDDAAALAVLTGLVVLHRGGCQADGVEGADEVDLDDLGVSGEVVWSLLADGLLRDADAGAVDDAGQRALRVRLLDECGDARFVDRKSVV